MNREDIIRMAREAGLFVHKEVQPEIERFFQLATEWQREACAKFIEDGYVRQFENPWREDLAAAIRARGETK